MFMIRLRKTDFSTEKQREKHKRPSICSYVISLGFIVYKQDLSLPKMYKKF